jgi:hypothetical protein
LSASARLLASAMCAQDRSTLQETLNDGILRIASGATGSRQEAHTRQTPGQRSICH